MPFFSLGQEHCIAHACAPHFVLQVGGKEGYFIKYCSILTVKQRKERGKHQNEREMLLKPVVSLRLVGRRHEGAKGQSGFGNPRAPLPYRICARHFAWLTGLGVQPSFVLPHLEWLYVVRISGIYCMSRERGVTDCQSYFALRQHSGGCSTLSFHACNSLGFRIAFRQVGDACFSSSQDVTHSDVFQLIRPNGLSGGLVQDSCGPVSKYAMAGRAKPLN